LLPALKFDIVIQLAALPGELVAPCRKMRKLVPDVLLDQLADLSTWPVRALVVAEQVEVS
jgi:hypothetical protein